VLPLEELLFFLLTNTLVVFGLVLVWSAASQERLVSLKDTLSRLWPGEPAVSAASRSHDDRQTEKFPA
jgi:hypothetical protein